MSETTTETTTETVTATKVERLQGTDHVVMMEYMDNTTKKAALLLGQTSHSTNYTNSLTEREGFKDMSVSNDSDVSWTEMADGKRQVTTSVSVGLAKKAEDQKMQKEILRRITSERDTSTTIYDGYIYPDSTDATKILFDGEKRVMKIASYNLDYPDGADITGTIEFQGAGVAPVPISGVEVANLPTYDPTDGNQ